MERIPVHVRTTAEARLVASAVGKADRFHLRLRGLLGRPEPDRHGGILIIPCRSVHTVGMSYSIDVIFLSRERRVLRIISELPPRRFAGVRGSRFVLELQRGAATTAGLSVGDYLEW